MHQRQVTHDLFGRRHGERSGQGAMRDQYTIKSEMVCPADKTRDKEDTGSKRKPRCTISNKSCQNLKKKKITKEGPRLEVKDEVFVGLC